MQIASIIYILPVFLKRHGFVRGTAWVHPIGELPPSLSPGETLWGIAFFFELISFVWPMELTLGIFVAFVFFGSDLCSADVPLFKGCYYVHWSLVGFIFRTITVPEKWRWAGGSHGKKWRNQHLCFFFLRYSTSFVFFPHTKKSPVFLRIFWVEYIPLLLQMLVLRRELRRFEALPKSDPNDRRSYH